MNSPDYILTRDPNMPDLRHIFTVDEELEIKGVQFRITAVMQSRLYLDPLP